VFFVIARSESDEAIHSFFGVAGMDCFAELAMTRTGLAAYSGSRVGKGALAPCPPSLRGLILNGGHASLLPTLHTEAKGS